MKSWIVVLSVLLTGCATQIDQQALQVARDDYQTLSALRDVERYAAKNMTRAEESLAKAERLTDFLGSGDDVNHYAYLSQRYSEIATLELAVEQLRHKRLSREQERTRLTYMLREVELVKAKEYGSWLEEQMLSLAATETDRGLVMTLEGVLFDVGSQDLGAGSHRGVLALGRFLQANPKRVVRIEGYSDSLGRADSNQLLSLARAQSVAQALIDLGVEHRRIQVRGYGEAYPIAENASARGRAQNRRVEVVFSDERGRLGFERE